MRLSVLKVNFLLRMHNMSFGHIGFQLINVHLNWSDSEVKLVISQNVYF